tara:strand:- start:11732 stop:12265 length:534 start_codon:yes stop_codon:yes gene_type:complete
MGLKQDLIDAKKEGLKLAGASDDAIKKAEETLEPQAQLEVDAIVNFLTKAKFRVTQFNAPVILEDFKIPEQGVNIELQTLLGDKAPILDTIKKIPGAAALVAPLEDALRKAIKPLLEGGSKLPPLELNKDSTGLNASGYTFVGTDPQTQSEFNVDSTDGQQNYTTVELLKDDIEDLL